MLPAGIVQRVEAGNRAADAPHLVIQKDPDRRRALPQDIVDELGRFNRHDSLQIDDVFEMLPT
ncbi:hypothetical protein SAMN02927923_04479 [Microvirga guangxiensis]|uniref:Uncharacterized protein n=1 Tax=Microvirga guangxiensis TaxID=549386 RepID=A0A1G5LMM3_9HYPH|nr:hypothetical protein SAMN02927923_04479 [Microvirga guangxiensis]